MLLIPNETTMSRELLSPQGHGDTNFISLPPLWWLQIFKPGCHVKAGASLRLNSQKPTLAAFNNSEYGLNLVLPKLFSLAVSSSLNSVPLSNYLRPDPWCPLDSASSLRASSCPPLAAVLGQPCSPLHPHRDGDMPYSLGIVAIIKPFKIEKPAGFDLWGKAIN